MIIVGHSTDPSQVLCHISCHIPSLPSTGSAITAWHWWQDVPLEVQHHGTVFPLLKSDCASQAAHPGVVALGTVPFLPIPLHHQLGSILSPFSVSVGVPPWAVLTPSVMP